MHAMTHPQARLDAIDFARQTILHDGRMMEQPTIDDWIERSWRRCLSAGQRPQDNIEYEAISTAQIKHIQESNQPLLQAASPELDRLSRAIAGTRYFALLTDVNGIVIDTRGEIDKQNKHASSIARIGVDLSEKRVGTTAIGAALAELKPVWLHRGEHFFKNTTVFSCAGAPLFGPDGRCVGMLDLTGVNTPERPELKLLAAQSARSIENALLRNQKACLQLFINWPGRLQTNDSDGIISLDEDGNIIGANIQARQMIAIDHINPHASDVFALPWQSLFDLANDAEGSEVPLWSGLRIQIKMLASHQPSQTFAGMANNAGALRDVESDLIRRVMQQSRGNVAEAAKRLGISRATLYRKIAPPRKKADAI
jgi:sigma-54 dependent transcriptional regulator, acetoin dehydrogenase operon transcriptional activator AcoR